MSSEEYNKKQEIAKKAGIPSNYWCLIQNNDVLMYSERKEDALKSHVTYVNRVCDSFRNDIGKLDIGKVIDEETKTKLVNATRNALTSNLWLIQVGQPQPHERIG
jgi:hypothetical protein